MSSTVVFLFACGLAAFCSASETAFSAAGRVQVAATRRRGTARALWFMEKPTRYLATTLVGTNLGVVLASSISHGWGAQLGGLWQSFVVFATAVFLLVFAEVIPKQAVLFRSGSVSVASAPVLYFLRILMYPLIAAASLISRLLTGEDSVGVVFESKKEVQGLLMHTGGRMGKLAAYVIGVSADSIATYSKPLEEFPGVSVAVTREDAVKTLIDSGEEQLLVWEADGATLLGAVECSALVRWDGTSSISNICIGLPAFKSTVSPLKVLSDLRRFKANAAVILDGNGQPEKLATAAMVLGHLFPEKGLDG